MKSNKKNKHGGNIYAYLQRKKQLIDFSANINALGFPGQLPQLIQKNISYLRHYPEEESSSLEKILAGHHQLEPANILPGNGSVECIYMIPPALKPDNVLIVCPTFSEYETAAHLSQAKLRFINNSSRHSFRLNMSHLHSLIPHSDLVFLGNPNSPTGTLLSKKELLPLLSICKRHKTTLVIDEAFMDFVEENCRYSLSQEVTNSAFLLVLKSMTKFFALPGLRLGYLIGHKKLIARLAKFQPPWNVNVLAQLAGSRIIHNQKYIARTKQFIRQEKEYLYTKLQNIPSLKVYPPTVNFILCALQYSQITTAARLQKKLLSHGLLIRNCGNFRGLNKTFFRVAVRKRQDNNRLLKALKTVLV